RALRRLSNRGVIAHSVSMRTLIAAVFVLIALAPPARAQSPWKPIGKTSTGNVVYVDPRSVKKVNGIVTARIRVTFTEPVKTPKGSWVASHNIAMFDCAKSAVAAKETIYYSDEAANKIVSR